MENLLRINKRLIPIEQIALLEPYASDPGKPLNSPKQFRARVVLLDKDSVLSEETVLDLAKAHGFRLIQSDGAATNPEIAYWVEHFEPQESFQPEKPYQSRLLWRAQNGLAHSRLMLASPETLLAVAVRGLSDPSAVAGGEPAPAAPRRRRAASRRGSELAKDPA